LLILPAVGLFLYLLSIENDKIIRLDVQIHQINHTQKLYKLLVAIQRHRGVSQIYLNSAPLNSQEDKQNTDLYANFQQGREQVEAIFRKLEAKNLYTAPELDSTHRMKNKRRFAELRELWDKRQQTIQNMTPSPSNGVQILVLDNTIVDKLIKLIFHIPSNSVGLQPLLNRRIPEMVNQFGELRALGSGLIASGAEINHKEEYHMKKVFAPLQLLTLIDNNFISFNGFISSYFKKHSLPEKLAFKIKSLNEQTKKVRLIVESELLSEGSMTAAQFYQAISLPIKAMHEIAHLLQDDSLQALTQQRNQLKNKLLWISIAGTIILLLVSLLSILVARNFAGYMNRGISILEQIGRGDFEATPSSGGYTGEIGALMQALTNTHHQLSTQQNKLTSLIYEMEQRREAVDKGTMVLVTDRDGVITHVNKLLTNFTGYSEEELLGENPRILRGEIAVNAEHTILWRTIHAGQVWSGNVCNQSKNGEIYFVKQTIIPLLDSTGEIQELISLQFDITELESSKSTMTQQIKELKSFQAVAIEREGRLIALESKLAEYQGEEILTDSSPQPALSSDESQHHIRILAVDDDPNILEGYHTTFDGDGADQQEINQLVELMVGETGDIPDTPYLLETVQSGEEGLQKIIQAQQQKRPFQVLCLDMMMPGGWDGLKTAQEIRAVDADIRIIIISAYYQEKSEQIAELLEGGYLFLNKPYQHAELTQLVSYLADDWHNIKELRNSEQSVTHIIADLKQSHDLLSSSTTLLAAQKLALDAHAVVSIAQGVTGAEEEQGKILEVNDAFTLMTGYSREEVLGERHSILSSGEHDADFFQELYQTIKSGEVWKGEIQDQNKAGELIWTDATVVPIMDEDGKMKRYIMVRTDITERKHQEQVREELLERHQIYQMILMALSTSGPLYSGDRKQGYEEITQAVAEALQVDRVSIWHYDKKSQKMLLQDCYSVIEQNHTSEGEMSPHNHPHIWEKIVSRQVAKIDDATDYSCCKQPDSYCQKNGVHSMMVAPLYDKREISGAISVENLRDTKSWRSEEMTFLSYVSNIIPIVQVSAERAEAEEQLRVAVNLAEKASSAKGDFLATMSHELRTPLTAMIGYGEELLSTTLQMDQRQMAETMALSGKSLLSLVNDILDLSKIEADKLEIDHASFSMIEMIFEVEQLFSQRASIKGINFSVIREDSECEYLFIGDGRRISQILINLLGNAIKFTEYGEVTLTIKAEQKSRGQMICHFLVEDSGIGMSAEVVERLFQPFEQADNTISRRFGGTGLGLHISQRLSELMAGEVKVSSEIGKGSVFELIVPLEISNELAPKILSGTSVPKIITALRGSVLIAEDTPELQLLERRLVESTGASVEIAKDGNEVVTKALEAEYDLILMDMQMPGRDGIEATRMIRAMSCETPIVALTANVMQHHRDQFQEAGVEGFLSKPIQREKLHQTLQRYLHPVEEEETESVKPKAIIDEMLDDELITLFMESLTISKQEIELAIEQKQWKDLRLLVHKIKGTGTTFGYPEITTLARKIEEALIKDDSPLAIKESQQLLIEINAILK